MLMLLLAAGLAMQTGPLPDSAAIYSVLLRGVRAENPGVPVVLAETRSGVECMPHCGAILDGEPGVEAAEHTAEHGAELAKTLRERGLIEATCRASPNTFGCAGHPGHIFVGLGEISERPRSGPPPVEGPYWVKVALLLPCGASCASAGPAHLDAFGYWALVRRRADGTWHMVRRLPAFVL